MMKCNEMYKQTRPVKWRPGVQLCSLLTAERVSLAVGEADRAEVLVEKRCAVNKCGEWDHCVETQQTSEAQCFSGNGNES